jgi:hypothetical protein
MGDDHTSLEVCRRGHIADYDYDPGAEWLSRPPALRREPIQRSTHCVYCGAVLMQECPNCGGRIRGSLRGVLSIMDRPDDFCDHCGTPYPWASRQARIFQLENLLDEDESMDEAERLKVREKLDELAKDADADPKVEEERWKKVRAMWPGLLTVGQSVASTLLSAELKRTFGLP